MAVRHGQKQLVLDLLQRGVPGCVTEGQGYEPSPLHVAAQLGQYQIARALLLHGVDRAALDRDGRTPLHLAARGGHLAVVDLILSAGTSADYVNLRCYGDGDRDDIEGETALDLAAGSGHADVVKSLLGHGAAVGASDAGGLTALHRVAAAVNMKCCLGAARSIDVLAEHGADLNATDEEGRTALHHAAKHGRSETVLALFGHGADVNALDEQGLTPLHVATDFSHVAIAKALLAAGADVNRRWGSAEHGALGMATNHFGGEVLRAMLAYGVDTNECGATGSTSLHAAAVRNNADAIDVLAEKGGSVDVLNLDSRTPLHVASFWDSPEAIMALVKHGADVNKADILGLVPLTIAARNCSCAAMEALLSAGADASIQFQFYGYSFALIEVTAFWENAGAMKALINHGADVDAMGELGSPLMISAFRNNVDAVGVLLEAGACANAAQKASGHTSLHLAIRSTDGMCCDTVRALLRKGADADAADAGGNSPLHWAAKLGGTAMSSKIVDILLRHGADETRANAFGHTAIEVIGMDRKGSQFLHEEAGQVRALLKNAPADRAWRRRGILVMCRALASIRVRPETMASRASRAILARKKLRGLACAAGVRDERETVAGASDHTAGVWGGWAARVLGLDDEFLFRTIVSFL